jgi:integrase
MTPIAPHITAFLHNRLALEKLASPHTCDTYAYAVGDAIRAWLAVRGEAKAPELFLNAWGTAMTRSGFERVLARHVAIAASQCSSLRKKRVSPHVLRHYLGFLTMSSDIGQSVALHRKIQVAAQTRSAYRPT